MSPRAPSQDDVEREVKFADVALDSIRDRLIELDAERVWPSALEDNWLLDRRGELSGRGCVLRLRLRKDGHGARLTFKGPAHLEGRTKVRREQEIEVNDAPATLALFESLGYQVAKRYQKMREMWQLGGVSICLDHTPIGDFAEFEGEGAETVAKRCGLDVDSAERRSYLRLYDDHLKEHPEAPPEMVFPER